MHLAARFLFAVFMSAAVPFVAHAAQSLPAHVFKRYTFAEDSAPKIKELLRTASQKVHQNPKEARPLVVRVFDLAHGGESLEEYDYTYALYLLLKSSFTGPNSSEFAPGAQADHRKVSRHLFEHLRHQGSVGSFVFTEMGQFRIEAFVTAGNGLAWALYQAAGKDKQALTEALDVIQASTRFADDPKYFYARDTEVRILLALERAPEAYAIVRDTLEEMPGFGDFRDIKQSSAYKTWRANDAGPATAK